MNEAVRQVLAALWDAERALLAAKQADERARIAREETTGAVWLAEGQVRRINEELVDLAEQADRKTAE